MTRWSFAWVIFATGCAVGAGPGTTRAQLEDAAVDGDDDAAVFGLFDADSTDTSTIDTGADAARSDAAVEATSIDVAPVDTAPPDRCAAKSDGAYCASRFGGGLDVHDLVHCKSGATASVDTCVAGCSDGATGSDACHSDPCATAKYGGYYCGQSTQEGFGGGIVDWLYDCDAGATKSSVPCAKGCLLEPPGTNDKCA